MCVNSPAGSRHHLLFEHDARFRLIEVHLVHGLLIFRQVALRPAPRLAI
jgi:hypothetical protein